MIRLICVSWHRPPRDYVIIMAWILVAVPVLVATLVVAAGGSGTYGDCLFG